MYSLWRMVIGTGVFFFFKQKTAYEMRISDWSSDVCSSDLQERPRGERAERGALHLLEPGQKCQRGADDGQKCQDKYEPWRPPDRLQAFDPARHDGEDDAADEEVPARGLAEVDPGQLPGEHRSTGDGEPRQDREPSTPSPPPPK